MTNEEPPKFVPQVVEALPAKTSGKSTSFDWLSIVVNNPGRWVAVLSTTGTDHASQATTKAGLFKRHLSDKGIKIAIRKKSDNESIIYAMKEKEDKK